MATLIKVNGETSLLEPENKKFFTLGELQKVVGGYIQMITTPAGRILVLNEEGKYEGFKRNETATRIARSCGIMPDDYVVGDVLWVSPTELEDSHEREEQ